MLSFARITLHKSMLSSYCFSRKRILAWHILKYTLSGCSPDSIEYSWNDSPVLPVSIWHSASSASRPILNRSRWSTSAKAIAASSLRCSFFRHPALWSVRLMIRSLFCDTMMLSADIPLMRLSRISAAAPYSYRSMAICSLSCALQTIDKISNKGIMIFFIVSDYGCLR